MCLCIPIDPLKGCRHQMYVDEAKEQSFKSKMCHKHGALLVYRGKIISRGFNYMVSEYNKNCLYSVHAEVSAIREFLRLCKRKGMKKDILKDCILYVVRTGKESMDYPTKMSKPCKNCYNFMKKHKIKKVFWSVDDY